MSSDRNNISTETAIFRKKFLLSLLVPGIFVFILWLVKISEILFQTDLSFLGIYPLEV